MFTPIYFSGSEIGKLPVYDTLALQTALMGAREIRAEIELPATFLSPIGAYIIYKGERFTVNTPPLLAEKISSRLFRYTVVFESTLYRLYDKQLKHLSNRNFQFYNDLSGFAQLIVDNINEIDENWTVGQIDDLPSRKIDFSGQTCRAALDMIAQEFKVEWQVSNKAISFVKKVGNPTTIVLRYGRSRGLYRISSEMPGDKNIITRAFGYGSTRNLPEGYRNGATQLMFDGGYVEGNIELYGVREGDFEDENIYPMVEGTVTSHSVFDPDSTTFTINDTTLAFDLNEYRSEDTPKISFTTGELQGEEFEIVRYNNSSKTMTIKRLENESYKLPNTTFQPSVGDKYTLFDMYLPNELVTAAELRLKTATEAWLAENNVPRLVYGLDLDPIYARDNGIILNDGDEVRLIDEDLGIDETIRVVKTNYPLMFPERLTPNTKITIEIANFIPYSITERVISDTIDSKHEIKVVDRTNSARARRNAVALNALDGRLFDPETGAIAPALRAAMAIYGYDSQNFNLVDVTISPNDGGDANTLVISAGTLVHRIYEIPGLGYEWAVAPAEFPALDPARFYYVYAKASRTGLTASWGISETPVTVNAFPGFWVFNVGVLYEVADGYRNFEFTKGMTYIVGDQITTGVIRSIDGNTFWDLNNASQQWGDAMDFNVTAPGLLNIKEALASKIIQVGSEGVINAGISGVTDAGTSSIRFWAGSSDKNLADFRVQDNGQVFATRVKLGYGEADGTFTGWDVTPSGILSDPKPGETENFALIRGTSYNKEFSFGTELIPATSGDQVSMVGRVQNNRPQTDEVFPTTNIALQLRADGANKNLALDINKGGIRLPGNKEALTVTRGIKIQDAGTSDIERVYEAEFVNGMLVRLTYVG